MIDVVLNVFAKPYQTALSVLSLLRFCEHYIDRIYFQFEPAGSRYDAVPPYAVASWLGERAVISQPEIWLKRDPVETSRLKDPVYRLAVRYQPAFERTDKQYLFIMHNDVLFTKDIIGPMLDRIGDAFAIGSIGQCWNCPASRAELMRDAGVANAPCSPDNYADCAPDRAGLERLYALARERNISVRPYWEGWDTHYSETAWPMPECRVNEWACLVDIQQTRPHTCPNGPVLPFGIFEACGNMRLDTAVAWFRDLNRLGLRARNFPLDDYMRHFVGNFRMGRSLYLQAENEARTLLEKNFRDFVVWCREKKNGMFS